MTKIICDIIQCKHNTGTREDSSGECKLPEVSWFAIYSQDEDMTEPVERAQLCQQFFHKGDSVEGKQWVADKGIEGGESK